MDKKILIVGRSATGKDTLAKYLCENLGLTQVISYTTRAKRSVDEDTHIFISAEEAESLTDRAAETVVNGNLYFATKDQVKENDIYIVDPNGLYQLIDNMPEQSFLVIYVNSDQNKARQAAEERGEDREREREIYVKRIKDEEQQFLDFDANIIDLERELLKSHSSIFFSTNDYSSEWLEMMGKVVEVLGK